MNAIDYIHPHYRQQPGAAEFAEAIREAIDPVEPDAFGQSYAWDDDVPPADQHEAKAQELRRHLGELGWYDLYGAE